MKSLAFLVVLAAGAAGPAAALVNGGFEQPGGVSATHLTAGSTFLPGWTVVDSTPGGDNEIQYTSNSAYGGLGVVSSQGDYFLELTGVVGRGKGVKSDAIDTLAGTTYRVGFDVGAFFVGGQGSYGDVTLDLLVGDTLVGSFANAMGLAGPGSDWERFTYDFVATGPSVRLTFLASTALTSSYLGAGLDNVTFDALPGGGGVPEPGVWALMILGFGLAGREFRRQVRPA
jgi:hypothetical protein